MKNIRALSFKPYPRTLNTHRITPYHVSSGGGKSPSVNLMYGKENTVNSLLTDTSIIPLIHIKYF